MVSIQAAPTGINALAINGKMSINKYPLPLKTRAPLSFFHEHLVSTPDRINDD
jgi:hypothetical protein